MIWFLKGFMYTPIITSKVRFNERGLPRLGGENNYTFGLRRRCKAMVNKIKLP